MSQKAALPRSRSITARGSSFRFRLYGLIFAIAISLFAFDARASELSVDDAVREVSYLLFCPVCQGQTVEESNSALAKDMRGIVRKKLEQGATKEEILAYFVGRYGESILASPPPRGVNWLLWLAPGALLVLGGTAIGVFLLKLKGAKRQIARRAPKAYVSPEYLEKVDKELKNFDS
ncbi:MAG: cytochrome c-type biogenesis protein [Deltaproteobacteria bacterium]